MRPSDLLALSVVFVMSATLAVAGALLGAISVEPLSPIPLPEATIATPVSFPTTPPIRATPLFVSTKAQPPYVPDHRGILMEGYLPEKPVDPVGH